MTVLIIQSRLGSTRLAGKALLKLKEKPILAWVFETMKKVKADRYFLATDYKSEEKLAPLAKEYGFECFAGSENDVLERFCKVIEKTNADTIIRATGDNPFLFYEAANESLKVFEQKKCDYFTFAGLPHGSGVEIFNAKSLLKACEQTQLAYDHEHVGPALYNHSQNFNCIFEPAPKEWNFPNLRTTIDTAEDFRRAKFMAENLEAGENCTKIVEYAKKCQNLILLVPSVKKGQGTGHLRRCVHLQKSLFADLYIPKNAELENIEEIIKDVPDYAIVSNIEDLCDFGDGKSLGGAGKKSGENCGDGGDFRENKEIGNIKNVGGQKKYSLIVTDSFCLEKSLAQKLHKIAPVLSLDEGTKNSDFCDFLLDIIPSVQLKRKANLQKIEFIPLPQNRKNYQNCQPATKIENCGENNAQNAENILTAGCAKNAGEIFSNCGENNEKLGGFGENNAQNIKKVLVAFGGEDPANLTIPVAKSFAQNNYNVFAILPVNMYKKNNELSNFSNIQQLLPVPNLKEQLFNYDLVVTHYGFTAFEAINAGCAVLLLATSKLHLKLSKAFGFATLKANKISAKNIKKIMQKPQNLFPKSLVMQKLSTAQKTEDLSIFLKNVSQSTRIFCPICGSSCGGGGGNFAKTKADKIVARFQNRTIRRCNKCGMLYLSFSLAAKTEYCQNYFFDEYKNQYGKTYLDDFASIKAQGLRRAKNIAKILHGKNGNNREIRDFNNSHIADETEDFEKTHISGGSVGLADFEKSSNFSNILDIGCAYGPFLAAANEIGFKPFGTDISVDAVKYVKNNLHFQAVQAIFPHFDSQKCFNIEEFDAVTMWYVIEHFADLNAVLTKVSKLLKTGGVFAFSTPSASGVSGKFNKNAFFAQSPSDHFSLWQPEKCAKILKKYGFKIEKIVSTGQHPERFPYFKNHKFNCNSFIYKVLAFYSKIAKLGDTFEVYCVKE